MMQAAKSAGKQYQPLKTAGKARQATENGGETAANRKLAWRNSGKPGKQVAAKKACQP